MYACFPKSRCFLSIFGLTHFATWFCALDAMLSGTNFEVIMVLLAITTTSKVIIRIKKHLRNVSVISLLNKM